MRGDAALIEHWRWRDLGSGEGRSTAVVSALLDALAPLGVADIEMPATPYRTWRAIMRK